MRNVALLSLTVLFGCAGLNKMSLENSYRPVPDEFGIYKVRTWNDGFQAHGQIMADNLSVHNFGGFVRCDWSAGGFKTSSETLGFELKSGAKQLLEFSALAVDNGRARMHLSCETVYLVCHDCGEKVVINR